MQAVRIIKSSKERSQDEDAKKDSPDKQPPQKKREEGKATRFVK